MKRGDRILMVLDHPFPSDARVENEAVSLINAGYEVGLLALSSDDRPAEENHLGISIFRSRVGEQLHMKLRGLAGTLPLFGWIVDRRVRQLYDRFPFDALHVHDLYLFGGGLRAAGKLGVPIVGDLHENYVEALKKYAFSTRYPGKLFVSIPRWEKLERKWVNAVDRLVVVIEEAADRNEQLGVSREKIFVVPNTPRLAVLDQQKVDDRIVDRIRSELTILYIGGFDLHRGLESVIEAMPKVLHKHPGALLVMVGDGRNRDELESLAQKHAITSNVRFEGWQPFDSVRSYVTGCDIGLVPHLRTPHTDATIPHKLFHYMYFEKPAVVTDCRPLKRIVENEGAGLVYKSGNSSELADAILTLAASPDRAAEMGIRGRESVRERLNWDVTARPLVDGYEKLSGGTAT